MPIPSNALMLILCWLFVILWGVWILPETIFIRNFCLILGAIIGLMLAYQHRFIFWQRGAIPICLILGLFGWVTIHLLWIGVDFDAQLEEFQTVWKRAFLAFFFALGLGIAIKEQPQNSEKSKSAWKIIYFGFCLPIGIYYIKWLATNTLPRFDLIVPKYLILSPDHLGNPMAIARAVYVFWFMPALAIALANLTYFIQSGTLSFKNALLNLSAILLTIFVFYLENDRFGSLISFLLITLAFVFLIWNFIKAKVKPIYMAIGALFISTALVLPIKNFQTNPQWKTLLADTKVAVQVDRYDHWKDRAKGYPVNEIGTIPTDSNYSRIAWAIVGTRLLIDNPQGHGKLSLSFSELGKRAYPDSELSWTHSGWLDFALGYGLIGLLFLAVATMISWYQSHKSAYPWRSIGTWGLGAMGLVFLVKEVSTEVPVNGLIFLIIFVSTLNLKLHRNHKNNSSGK